MRHTQYVRNIDLASNRQHADSSCLTTCIPSFTPHYTFIIATALAFAIMRLSSLCIMHTFVQEEVPFFARGPREGVSKYREPYYALREKPAGSLPPPHPCHIAKQQSPLMKQSSMPSHISAVHTDHPRDVCANNAEKERRREENMLGPSYPTALSCG